MNTYLSQLRSRMDDMLNALPSPESPVQYFRQSALIVRSAIRQIKQFMHGYSFENQEEEIEYYKEWMPQMLGDRQFYSSVHALEVERERLRPLAFRAMLEAELTEADRFFEKHRWLYAYHLRGEVISDTLLFTRAGILGEELDEACCTGYSYQLSKIIGYRKYRRYIEESIYRLEHPSDAGSGIKRPFGKCVATKSAVAEVLVCIAESGAITIDGKKATITQLVEKTGEALDIDLKDFKNLDYANRSRKKDLTPFMNSMIEKFKERATRLNK